jgi:hypothetical protein
MTEDRAGTPQLTDTLQPTDILALTFRPVKFSTAFSRIDDRPHRPVMASEPPAWSFARYKDALVSRRFSNNSLLFCSLPPSYLPAPPPRVSGRAELHLLPLPGPLAPTEPASGNNVAARGLTLIRSTPRQYCLVDCLTRASTPDNDADKAPGVLAGRWRLGHATTSDPGPLLSLL